MVYPSVVLLHLLLVLLACGHSPLSPDCRAKEKTAQQHVDNTETYQIPFHGACF